MGAAGVARVGAAAAEAFGEEEHWVVGGDAGARGGGVGGGAAGAGLEAVALDALCAVCLALAAAADWVA